MLSFHERLRERILLGDGAMGTYLLKHCSQGICLEALSITDPQKVLEVHRAYLASGAEILRTHTFGANRHRLKAGGLEAQVRRICEAACGLISAIRTKETIVAGSVGPTGLNARENVSQVCVAFDEQMEAFVRGGVDLLVFETFTTLFEARLAVRSCISICGLPFVVLFSCRDDLYLADNVRVDDALLEMMNMGAAVAGLNCVLPEVMQKLLEANEELESCPLAFFPSRGVPQSPGLYPLTHEQLIEQLKPFLPVLCMVGGCCGTTPETIAALRRAVKCCVKDTAEAGPGSEKDRTV